MTTRALSFAVQMDPVTSIDISCDSTFALALEAQPSHRRLPHVVDMDVRARQRPQRPGAQGAPCKLLEAAYGAASALSL